MTFFTFIILLLIFITFFCYLSYRVVAIIESTAFFYNCYISDLFVDAIVEKAVIISEIEIERTEQVQERKEGKKIELACSIIADVLLQHNLKPKNYNLPALVNYMRFKTGLNCRR